MDLAPSVEIRVDISTLRHLAEVECQNRVTNLRG
jgi:hypothetical protein